MKSIVKKSASAYQDMISIISSSLSNQEKFDLVERSIFRYENSRKAMQAYNEFLNEYALQEAEKIWEDLSTQEKLNIKNFSEEDFYRNEFPYLKYQKTKYEKLYILVFRALVDKSEHLFSAKQILKANYTFKERYSRWEEQSIISDKDESTRKKIFLSRENFNHNVRNKQDIFLSKVLNVPVCRIYNVFPQLLQMSDEERIKNSRRLYDIAIAIKKEREKKGKGHNAKIKKKMKSEEKKESIIGFFVKIPNSLKIELQEVILSRTKCGEKCNFNKIVVEYLQKGIKAEKQKN